MTRGLPVLSGQRIDRSRDRAVTTGGIAAASLFLLAAVAAVVLPDVARGAWLPLHLVLAGGASVAIAAVLPFFAASLMATPPAPTTGRVAAVALTAAGAMVVTVGVPRGELMAGAAGGVLYLAGMVVVLVLVLRLLRGSLVPRRRIFSALYGAALASVLVGATLSVLFLAGVPAVLAAWPTLRVAHAWANLFGFVGLVIATTLIHFYPTVVGARIEQGRVVVAGLGGLAAGPALVVAGFIVGHVALTATGAVLAAAGAVVLAGYAVDVLRRRARWTTDPDWHRFAIGSLTSSIGWLVASYLAAAASVLVHGPGPGGWVGGAIMAPLVLGGVAQVVVGSWSHLLPAIGPGSPVQHAWQRRVLGRAATVRLVAFQAGVALLAIATLTDRTGPIVTAGASLTALSMLASGVLLAVALLGRGERPSPGTASRL